MGERERSTVKALSKGIFIKHVAGKPVVSNHGNRKVVRVENNLRSGRILASLSYSLTLVARSARPA